MELQKELFTFKRSFAKMNFIGVLFSCLVLLCVLQPITSEDASKTVKCLGTRSAFSVAEDRLDHLSKMIKRYTNCTLVQGNLEITGLEDPTIDTSFLKDIEIVTGYVLIAINYVPSLPLGKLKIIRGQELYGPDKLALHVAVNFNRDNPTQGLRELGFKSLTEIQRGNISLIQNNRMCYADSINWLDIMNPTQRRQMGWRVNINNTIDPKRTSCGKCDSVCTNGSCWGEGPEMCQKLTSSICHSNCGDARCRGPGREDCCDSECASGCTGPTDRDCIACLHVDNNGICQSSCPPQYIYDSQTSRNIPNPNFKYHFNNQCVDKCPNNMLVEENGCVKHCRKGSHNNGSGVCVPCIGNQCNKECFGVGDPDGPLKNSDTVDSKNVHFFEGCNIVRGNVIFQAYAFSGDSHTKTPPMTAEQVQKAFSAVKVINGHLKILSWPEEMDDFSVFSNLTTIIGVDLFRNIVSLLIQDSITKNGPFHLSHVKRIGFRSLKTIQFGNVYIGYMRDMCYQDLVNWTSILKNPVVHTSFKNGILLRANAANCENATCHEACSSNGCWGPGGDECLDCSDITYAGTCRTDCEKSLGIYRYGDTCRRCHRECNGTCDGAGPSNCSSCVHFRDGNRCVKRCPNTKYPDPNTLLCMPCHENCIDQDAAQGNTMCTGPNTTLGRGGCEYCHLVVTDRDLYNQECLPPLQTSCPDAHFLSVGGGLVAANQACVPCIEGCNNCTGSTDKDCLHSLPVKSDTAVVIAVVITSVALGLIALSVFLLYHRREKSKKKRQMSMRALGVEGSPEPMTPSGVAPNQAQLRIVKETELRIGKILGSGAFGTVHKGYWIPDLAPREKVKVPVAIKVLRDESSQVASNEILDEAFVMASCEHTNLVRILGISLSQRIMLITQLMPLGNLLEYVRDNKDNIGSQNLLNWSLQIAKGMCYLAEEKHLVHRDLAARNVLVKSPNHVRITDFGLAKLLDVNEDVYRAEGGKMPIKWLALESIQHRIFTQKSDVWSFGVTVWELMTFGKKPYENVPAREVHTLLERGERLVQPMICTIDVYMLMIKCWTVEVEARPAFRELVEEFSKMARDPQRYLVIPNDGRLAELPSPTTSEFFRTLKYEEGDDFPLQDAEEYFHPSPEDFDNANGGHFPLQPAPIRAQWRKQEDQRRQINGRFPSFQSSNADSRLDSAVTVMTSLPSESGSSFPNGCSTPFGFNPMGSMTPGQSRDNPVFEPFGRSSNRMPRDQIQVTNALQSHQSSGIGPRTQSESSDVFLNTPSFQRKDAPWNGENVDQCGIEHAGVIRARENSATMRYSAEPALFRQESRPNEKSKHGAKTTFVDGFHHDEDGYLSPTDDAKQKPEYLDPMAMPPTPMGISPGNRDNFFGPSKQSHGPSPLVPNSSMENPEYEPTFTPGGRGKSNFTPGMHNLLGARASIPVADDGYEVPMAKSEQSQPPLTSTTEYENITSGGATEISEDGDGYLTATQRMLPRRRDSHSGESTSSEKRDSGMQSEGDEEAPLKAKNVKPAAGDAGNTIVVPGVRKRVDDLPLDQKQTDHCTTEKNNNTSVDNPNYELLENMTDGGFQPMSEFKPKDEYFTSVQPVFSNTNNNFGGFHPAMATHSPFDRGNNSSLDSNSRKNPLKLVINCDGDGCEDFDDNIFVTPESRRRNPPDGKFVAGDGDDFFASVETETKACETLIPGMDELSGKVTSRTYSEPDSGVGIELGIDNMLYHRLGSSGWENSD